ncbi:MAG: NAD(P)-binding domain-containing protein [Gammaproteobacteria bacterium]|jgi:pyrroline-5-carboxylate reductase|nr:NAD(P)-binding domain-containing protein [Gammaproteobacteria bacterium]
MHTRLGFIGTGHLASYTIAGLRRAGDQRDIILSPRNAQKAAQLAAAYQCQVVLSNQAVVDAADTVILAVRPPHALAVLSEITLRPGQKLVSVVAGVTLADLRAAVRGEADIYRSSIVSGAAYNTGPIPLYPADAELNRLLALLGEVVTCATEQHFDLALAPMCANGWIYPLVAALEQPMLAAGMPASKARSLVVQAILGTLAHIQHSPELDLNAVTEGIATPGTFTKLGLDILQQEDAFAPWQAAVQALLMAQDNPKNLG